MQIPYVSQEFLCLLWNLNLYHSIHMSPPQVPAIIHMIPGRIVVTYLVKIYFNVILPSTARFPKLLLFLRLND